MRQATFVIALTLTAALTAPVRGAGPMDQEEVLQVTLNGLEIALDRQTGGIVRLSYPGVGVMLEAGRAQAGLLDLAYPIPQFEPLRLACRYSEQARVEEEGDGVTITWEALGASRTFPLGGQVRAVTRLQPAPEGRSLILSCEIENRSDRPVRQVLFPDLRELLPFAGEADTVFRTAGVSSRPFLDLRVSELDQFYAVNNSTVEYQSGGLFNPMVLRWMDLGSLRGGFSLFPRRWGWDPHTTVVLQLTQATGRLRLACVHSVEIRPGGSWRSGEFWLTPHRNGWAKGIEPYREWARQNVRREHPLPAHVRDGLGYRTAWMCQNQPQDPQDAIWHFRDLPALAREAKEHGLEEMVLWSTHPAFTLPLPPPFPHLGSEEELVQAVAECRRLGVNVAPFISVLQADAKTAPRYGFTVTSGSGNWTYHTEMLPRFTPPYASNLACVQAGPHHPQWQEDVLESCRRLIEIGIPSIAWDQYFSSQQEPSLQTLTARIRALAKARDPESTFSGEELWNIEVDCNYLDYTWDWGNYRDVRPLINVLPAPRINVNINTSPEAVKLCFADNLYLNVWPARPDSINGSDFIANHPELSRALKQCAQLRRQFLAYFTQGTLIGDCILAEAGPSACHLNAYVLPDRLLIVCLNQGDARALDLTCDAEPWLPSASGRYTVYSYDQEGTLVSTAGIAGGRWNCRTPKLKPLELALYELVAG